MIKKVSYAYMVNRRIYIFTMIYVDQEINIGLKKLVFKHWYEKIQHETFVYFRKNLNIKLGLMNRFFEALPEYGDCFEYSCRKCLYLTEKN